MEVIKLFSYSFLYSFCDTISKNWRILMPKYSIIIPCYNGMPYVKSCVDSIINQNYTDYELIISEDHSVHKMLLKELYSINFQSFFLDMEKHISTIR